MKVEVMQLKGLTLIGRTESNHWVIMDSPYKEFGGENSAPSPMELLLMAVGGCTAMDVISILKKMRVDFKRVEVVVEGERHKDHPKYFEGIDILYKIYGKNIKHEQVQRAIDLSRDKYCSVIHTVNGVAKINYSYEIIEE